MLAVIFFNAKGLFCDKKRNSNSMTNEVDWIYMLLIFSLVYNDWKRKCFLKTEGVQYRSFAINEN
jgi:hypothetical protein